MSKKSKLRNELFKQYFKEMSEASKQADEELISVIKDLLPNLNKNVEQAQLIKKLYEEIINGELGNRMGKPKSKPYLSKLVYQISGGKMINEFAPIMSAMAVMDSSFYPADDVIDTCINDKNIISNKLVFSHILKGIADRLLLKGLKTLKISKKRLEDVMDIWTRLPHETYEGMYIEMNNDVPNRDVYWGRLKAYAIFGYLYQITSLVANTDEKIVQNSYLLGQAYGEANMLVNDILDFGKKFEDIRTGKWLLPNIMLFERIKDSEENLSLFKSCFGNENAEKENLMKLGKLMIDKGVVDDSLDYVLDLVKKCKNYITLFPGYEKEKQMLILSLRLLGHNYLYQEVKKSYNTRGKEHFFKSFDEIVYNEFYKKAGL